MAYFINSFLNPSGLFDQHGKDIQTLLNKTLLRSLLLSFVLFSGVLAFESKAQDPSQTINNIEIVGTSDLEKSQILFIIESQVGEALDQRKLRQDVHILHEMNLYRDVQLEVEPGENGYILRYRLKELARLADIQIQGVTLVSKTEIEKQLTIKIQDVYDVVKLRENEEIILEEYRKEGYPKVKVRSRVVEVDEMNYEIIFEIDEKPRVFLTDIYINGTQFYTELDIKRFILSAEIDCFSWMTQSGVFREEMINQDLALISQQYLKNGFIKVFINKPQVTIINNPDFSWLEVRLNIDEGSQYYTGNVEISGDILGDKEDLLEVLKLKNGEVYNPFLQNQDRSQLNELYQEQGYAFVRVVPRTKIDDETRTVDVNYQVIKREKAYIGRVEIAGNAETQDHVIRREFEVAEKELFNGKKLRLSQESLMRLGFFEPGLLLEQRARERQDNVFDILTRLKEAQTGTFQAQLGFSDLSGFSGGLQLSKGNILGTGRTLRLNAQFAEKDVTQQFDITLIEPRLFDSLVSGSIFTSRKRISDSTGLNLGMVTEYTYGFSLGTPIYYRNLRLSSRFSALDRIYESDQSNVNKRSVSPSLSYNTVNHPVFPTAGMKTSIGLTQTGEPFGGNVRLREYRFLYQQFWSLNMNSTLILMAKAQMGYLQKQGDKRVPSEDRYRIGGMNSIRAHPYYVIAGPFSFREQSLNQVNEIIVDENGYQQLKTYDKRTVGLSIDELQQLESGGIFERIFNLELLFPLSRDEKSFVRGVVFADVGNVNSESVQYRLLGEKEPGFFDLRKSTGAGVRVITPMGVLRFEYGMKLDARRGESPDRFEFTVSGLF